MEWSGTPAVAEIEAIVEPDGVGNNIGPPPRCGGRLAGIGGACMCSWPECISLSHLTWQYPLLAMAA
jgi:hypothetical protein